MISDLIERLHFTKRFVVQTLSPLRDHGDDFFGMTTENVSVTKPIFILFGLLALVT